MLLELACERWPIGAIEGERGQRAAVMRTRDAGRGFAVHVCELHLIVAGFCQQAGDQRADFSGAQYQNAMHDDAPSGGGAFCPFGCI